MKDTLFHIFRNSPLGRETLLQSIYFCQKLHDVQMNIFIPNHTQFLMYFNTEVVTIDLDSSYTEHLRSARDHAIEILDRAGMDYIFHEPHDFTANTLPNIPTSMTYMTCPRSIIEDSFSVGFGYIGSRVRRIVKSASFPVMITPPIYKEWKSITAFYGGSRLGRNAVRMAFHVASRSHLPLTIFTQLENQFRDTYEKNLEEGGLLERIQKEGIHWQIFETGDLEENLYQVPYDSLVVVGAAGHGSMKELIFGSKLERIQKTLPNPLLIVGPHCS